MWSYSENIWPNAQRNWPNVRAFDKLRSHLVTVGRIDQMHCAIYQTLRIWSNAARLTNWSNALRICRLVKCALHRNNHI